VNERTEEKRKKKEILGHLQKTVGKKQTGEISA
jgi:hypothetical protein